MAEKEMSILEPDSSSLKSAKDEYFRLLQEWTSFINLQNAFRCMSYFPLATAPVASNNAENVNTENVQTPPRNFPFSAARLFDPSRNDEIIRVNGGFEHVIAPLYKRFLAEIIDTVILFLVKILFFVFFLDFLDIHIGLDIDDFKDMKFLEDDYSQLLSLSSDFLLLEIVTKIVSCLYEAFFTASRQLQATPGKLLMGLRILHAEAAIPIEQQLNHSQGIRALIFPASQLGFKRALFRSLAKNLLVTLLFPVYFMLFFYKSNQLIYDLLGKTVVVEFQNIDPVLRRRNQ